MMAAFEYFTPGWISEERQTKLVALTGEGGHHPGSSEQPP
jgi:hypothetical protein